MINFITFYKPCMSACHPDAINHYFFRKLPPAVSCETNDSMTPKGFKKPTSSRFFHSKNRSILEDSKFTCVILHLFNVILQKIHSREGATLPWFFSLCRFLAVMAVDRSNLSERHVQQGLDNAVTLANVKQMLWKRASP